MHAKRTSRRAPGRPAGAALSPAELDIATLTALDNAHQQIAVVDAAGAIVAVNRTWLSFVRQHGVLGADADPVGMLYMPLCRAGGLAMNADTEAGLAAVLAGTAPHFELEHLCTHGGAERWFLMRASPLASAKFQGEGGAVITHEDITARRHAEQQIRNLAFIDPLTGLPNRRLLFDRMQQACATTARQGQHGALLFIDLDHFKLVNDTLGHDHGDLLLQEVARRLQSCVRGEDTVSRIGGDEFVVMSVGLDGNDKTAATQAAVVSEKILAAVSQPMQLGDHPHSLTPSIGVSLFRGREHTLDELIKRADVAMYQAKAAGRGTVRFFDPVMQAGLDARVALESDLKRAMGSHQLSLHFQGQVDEHRGTVGAEALLRWVHPQRGLLRPEQFLPLAEQNGLIVPIGTWVIDKACAQLGRWQAEGLCKQLHLSVNVSARQFRHEGFVDSVAQALERHGADPRRLRLELRESLVQDNPARTLSRMGALKDLGVGFVLDDFGISYSSLSLLKRLPLDQIKISQTLMRTLLSDPHDAAIVRTIVGIADGMGLRAGAVGVETRQQRDLLLELGCHQWQGDYFGAPAPMGQFEARMAAATGQRAQMLN